MRLAFSGTRPDTEPDAYNMAHPPHESRPCALAGEEANEMDCQSREPLCSGGAVDVVSTKGGSAAQRIACSCCLPPGMTGDEVPLAGTTNGAPGRARGDGSTPHVIRLLSEFEEKSKQGGWPASTSVHCYWCCHRFPNEPVGQPVAQAGEMFHVVGCYCSFECAAAANFASRAGVDEILHRYTLLNVLAAQMGVADPGNPVRPSPDRLALTIFGGHLGIAEFRAFSRSGRQVVVHWPPMLTLTQQVEEVNESEMRSEYKYVPLDRERVNRIQERIRLRRTKPLINYRNTLDHAMNLRIAPAMGEATPA